MLKIITFYVCKKRWW